MKLISTKNVNLLRQKARSVVRELGLLSDAFFDIGVTLAERHLLIELSASTHITAKEISESLLLDKSTVSRLISRTVKKGYIKYTIDEKDKRRHFLKLTKKGKNVLDSFEKIAFKQTKDALLTLSPDQIEKVYQGVALYAEGLKNARMKK